MIHRSCTNGGKITETHLAAGGGRIPVFCQNQYVYNKEGLKFDKDLPIEDIPKLTTIVLMKRIIFRLVMSQYDPVWTRNLFGAGKPILVPTQNLGRDVASLRYCCDS